ncbi:FAD-dependent pyridine nucleotide-disulfide oxidoreductase [Nitzschia inconspicua]|uniref:NADH:ubiquinone reductase (non-electrogenic) n=1 Tax=Nitzschia inconspicua TaxID=303405 RepID=A0A9K3LB58_9STRA|nr:FAD-dependent pyridine nucleotide-disulfide oxidoreductase [Nitzschia inconspicua]
MSSHTTRRLFPRIAGAAVVCGVGSFSAITTINDDWDDYTNFFSQHQQQKSEKPNERIVILGSGWGGLSALRKCYGPNKDIVIISPRPHFLYTPLLAGSAVGTIALQSACEPIRALVAQAASKSSSVTYVRADARHIDVENKRVYATEDGVMDLELSYDKLLVAVGAQTNTFGVPGVQEYGLFLKEAEDSAKLHAKLLSNLERASALIGIGDHEKYSDEINRLLKIVVVGAGPTGVELAAELADFKEYDVKRLYGEEIASRLQITLVEALPRILGPFDKDLADVAKKHLMDRGVDVRTGVAVTRVDSPKAATFAPSTPRDATPEEKADALAQAKTEPIGTLVWAGGIGPRPLVQKLARSLGQSDTRGLKVDECQRVVGADGVYAIGDAALDGYAPTAQVATQQGKHIGRAFRDGVDRPFVYKHAGSLCSLGHGNGIAQLVAPNNAAINIWDVIGAPAVGPNNDQRAVTGLPAFAMWRSLYWSKLLSNSSRLSLSMDWLKAQLTGREVAGPVLQRKGTYFPSKGSNTVRAVECFGTPLRRNPTIARVSEIVEEKKSKRFGFF